MNLEKLSDNQLIEIFKSNFIDKDLRNKIIYEIDRRDLEKPLAKKYNFVTNLKIFIFFTNLALYKYHVKKANEIMLQGDREAYKLYWKIFSFGVGFSFIVLVIVAKYFLNKP